MSIGVLEEGIMRYFVTADIKSSSMTIRDSRVFLYGHAKYSISLPRNEMSSRTMSPGVSPWSRNLDVMSYFVCAVSHLLTEWRGPRKAVPENATSTHGNWCKPEH